MPAAIPLGPLGSMVSIEVARTSTGTLAIRGPMVPMSPYGLASGEPPLLKVDGKNVTFADGRKLFLGLQATESSPEKK